MKAARKSICGHKAKELEGNAESAGKGVQPLRAKVAKASVSTKKQRRPVRKPCGENADAWMENIKEFIRNIDVKSL